ncbi:MAG: DUF424 domain-containing protein [Candidatus Heimdallarchaeota archaeon]
MPENQRFYLRARQTEKEYLVAICDAELLGETICDGDLELYVSERFFGGELIIQDKCIEEMLKATSLNIIGQSIVNLAIKHRIINEQSVMWIDCPEHGKVGHAMLLR